MLHVIQIQAEEKKIHSNLQRAQIQQRAVEWSGAEMSEERRTLSPMFWPKVRLVGCVLRGSAGPNGMSCHVM